MIRAQHTAQPLADLLGMEVTHLAGLNEIHAGWFDGRELDTLTQIAYALPTLMWVMGQYWVPMMGSTIDPNGVAFNDRVTDAIETVYNHTVSDQDNPLSSAVFAHAGTIAIWTLMNVKNPDFGLVIKELLDTQTPLANTGQVVIEGNPTDGWTLVSWEGHEVSATPDLLTGLFVDWRDLTTAPQIAAWHILEAFQGGDQADITAALQTGFDQVVAAFTAFPQAVIDTLSGAFSS
jgi:broad specificity phosphatase PhoE